MTVERARRDVSREPRPWCARARLRGIVSSDTSRRHVRPALPRADAASYRAPRRVIDACRVRSRRSPRRRVRDARASSPAAPRLDPHRLTSPRLVSHPSSRVSRSHRRRTTPSSPRRSRRSTRSARICLSSSRTTSSSSGTSAWAKAGSAQPTEPSGEVRTRETPAMASRALGTRKNAHRIPYASLERSLPSDEEPPERFPVRFDRRGGVRARRGHDPRVVRGGGGGHGRRYARSRSLDAFPADARVPDDSETAARRNADSDPRSRLFRRWEKLPARFFFAILFQSGNRRNAV